MTQSQQEPPAASRRDVSWTEVLVYPLACLGALLGAAAGVLVLKLGLEASFYAEVAIGLLAGWGAGLLARRGGWSVGIIAGVVTLIVGIWAEWKFAWTGFPDSSLGYFLRHLAELPPFRLLLHAVGVAMALWLGARK